MTGPSRPIGSDGQLSLFEVDRKVLDSLRFRIERLISQEISATLPVQGRTARESSSVQPELFDSDTGRCIFA